MLGEAIVRKKFVSQGEVGAAVRRQTLDLIGHVLQDGLKVASFTNSLRTFYVPARITLPHVLLELSRNSDELFEPQPEARIALNAEQNNSDYPWNPQELNVLTRWPPPRRSNAYGVRLDFRKES